MKNKIKPNQNQK